MTWLFPLSHWRLSFNLSRIWSGDSLTHSEVFVIRMTAPVPGPHSCERSRIISTRVDSTHTGVPSSWVSITMLISADLAAARTARTCAVTVWRHCFRRFFGFAMPCKQVRERFISSTQKITHGSCELPLHRRHHRVRNRCHRTLDIDAHRPCLYRPRRRHCSLDTF